MLKQLSDLLTIAKVLPIQKLVVVASEDEVVIDAVNDALNLGIIKPILIGNQKVIQDIIVKKGYELKNYEIIQSDSLENSSLIATNLIRSNKADILMKGLIDTKILLKAVVNKETGIKDSSILSHVALFSYKGMKRVLFATDCAMMITPTVDEKVEIIKNAVFLTKALGYTNPKVGIVSCVEKVNPKIASTVDAEELVARYKKGFIKDCILDGPFAIDNLVSASASKHKSIASSVAGNADILIFPNIDSGNIFYKTSVFLAKAEVAGIVVGAKVPIVLTSRADSSKSKLYSILLALVYNYGKTNLSH